MCLAGLSLQEEGVQRSAVISLLRCKRGGRCTATAEGWQRRVQRVLPCEAGELSRSDRGGVGERWSTAPPAPWGPPPAHGGGCRAQVFSHWALVTPIFTAMAAIWIISGASGPTMWQPSTTSVSQQTTSF